MAGGKSGGARVHITGLDHVIRAFSDAEVGSANLQPTMEKAAKVVENRATELVPVRTGRLRSSIRSGAGPTKGIVSAGADRAIYGPPVHYGDPNRNIEPQPFMTEAVRQSVGEVERVINDGIDDLLRESKLK